MDYAEDFWSTAGAVAARLVSRGRNPSRYTDSHGNEVYGWLFDSKSSFNFKGDASGKGYFEDLSSDSEWLLSREGRVWLYRHWVTATPEETRSGDSLEEVPEERLVGDRGKPFSGYKAQLEKLQYK